MDFLQNINLFQTIIDIIIVICVFYIIYSDIEEKIIKNKAKNTLLENKSGKTKKSITQILIDNVKIFAKLNYKIKVGLSISGLDNTYTAEDIMKKCFTLSLVGIALGILIKNPIGCILLGFIFFSVPYVKLNEKVNKKLNDIDKQILTAIQYFLNEYSKTKNIPEIINAIAPTLEMPIKKEFERIAIRLNSGIPYEEVFEEFASRLKNEYIYLFSNAMIVNKQKGVDVSPILMKTIIKISNKQLVKADEGMEMVSGKILNMLLICTIPIAFIASILLQPEALNLYFNTGTGRIIIDVSLILVIISSVIQKFSEKL